MAWADSNYLYRAIVNADGSAWAGGNADIDIALDPGWDHFWDNIQADGDDIRIYGPSGVAYDYEWNGYNYTTKTGTIEVDNYPVGAATLACLYLYYGYTAATDGSSSFVSASDVVGYVTNIAPNGDVFQGRPEAPGVTIPLQRAGMSTTDAGYKWWDVTDSLTKAATPVNDHPDLFELYYIDLTAAGTATTAQYLGSGVYSSGVKNDAATGEAYFRATLHGGRLYVGMWILGSALTDATDYELYLEWWTTAPANLGGVVTGYSARALLQVNDPDEA